MKGSLVDPRLGRITVSEWWDQWWPTVTNLRPRTRARDAQFFRSHVLPTLGNTPLGKLDRTTLRRWMVSLGNPDGPALAPATIHKVVQVLNKSVNAAVEDRIITHNPVARLPLPKIEHQEMRLLDAHRRRAPPMEYSTYAPSSTCRPGHRTAWCRLDAAGRPSFGRDVRWGVAPGARARDRVDVGGSCERGRSKLRRSHPATSTLAREPSNTSSTQLSPRRAKATDRAQLVSRHRNRPPPTTAVVASSTSAQRARASTSGSVPGHVDGQHHRLDVDRIHGLAD